MTFVYTNILFTNLCVGGTSVLPGFCNLVQYPKYICIYSYACSTEEAVSRSDSPFSQLAVTTKKHTLCLYRIDGACLTQQCECQLKQLLKGKICVDLYK